MSERELFIAALRITDPVEQSAWLDRECHGDDALRRRIDVLLVALGNADSLLDRPVVAPVPDRRDTVACAEPGREGNGADEQQTGQVLGGRYQLLELLGEGGMGAVWLAQQTEPIKRPVAVKLIKPGMDSRAVLARFEAERQTLALMDHPNIAKVLDAGVAPDGRPFFVMELVQGAPITRYCDVHSLTPRQRLELFISVCQAIQHAHQKGIIHRDIKPSNVLVTLYDGRPVVKVIDFGIAKATEQRFTEAGLPTGFGAVVGTPEYMSPEQASFNQLDIDTRSDVYSLGVLLYELLTGSPPFCRTELQKAGLLEILRVIREQDPPRPSTKLSTAEGLPALAANRGMEPRRLTNVVRGELDWVVMKALEKDRARRYETANGLAGDIRRYLRDEPVQAGPPGAGYRLRKFVKRNRGPVLAATAVLLALLAGIVGTTLGLVEAIQARKDEAGQRLAAETNADRAREEEGKAKAASEEAQKSARDEKAARERADRQLLRAEWLLYASRLRLAEQAWDAHDFHRANLYLRWCREDFRGWEHDYLFTRFHRNPYLTIRAQRNSAVTSLALSPDGKRLVSGSLGQPNGNATVDLWDVDTGKNLLTLDAGRDRLTTLALSPDGKRIISASCYPELLTGSARSSNLGMTVRAHDAVTGKELLTFTDKASTYGTALSLDGTRILSGCLGAPPARLYKVWDVETGRNVLSLKEQYFDGFTLSHDGKRILGASGPRIKVLDGDTGQELLILEDTVNVTSLSPSADGNRIVSGNVVGVVKVWDADTGKTTLTLGGHNGAVRSVGLSQDGKRIVSGGADMTVRVWDAVTGQQIRIFRGHVPSVGAVNSDGTRIAGFHGGDGALTIWDTTAPEEPEFTPAGAGLADAVAVSHDGQRILTAHSNTVTVWNAVTGRQLLTFHAKGGTISSLAMSPDGKRIAGWDDSTGRVWDAATGQELLTLDKHTGGVSRVSFSPDGKRIVSAAQDGTVKVWDEAGHAETRTLAGAEVMGRRLALSHDARYVVGVRNDGKVQVWDVDTGKNTLTLTHSPGGACSAAISADGKRVATGGGVAPGYTVKVWDAVTGAELAVAERVLQAPIYLAWTGDGKRIVGGTHADNTTTVWDAETGYETFTLKGNLITVSPDGKRLAYWTADGKLKVWDAGMKQR